MAVNVLDPFTRDLSADIVRPDGKPKVLPASYYAGTTPAERAMACLLNGFYGLPTEELVATLRSMIDGRRAIEIGSGHGGLAEALGIPATDNRMQEDPRIAASYRAMGQPTIRYGSAVERIDANEAVAKYRPEVVVASWVTHRYDPRRHAAGGNAFGVDERSVVDACRAYIFVGNRQVHAGKEIWSIPHRVAEPSFVYSRAFNGTPDFVAAWGSVPESSWRIAP